MPAEEPTVPHETPRDPIHISQENGISIQEALEIAEAENVPLGKSTLQRWALTWEQQHAQSPVKCVAWIVTGTKTYVLDREEFRAWLFERKQNMRPNETVRDPAGSHEVSQDPARPRQASGDPMRPRETSQDSERSSLQREESEELIELRKKVMNLTIDLEVRKQLLERASTEIDRERSRSENVLRENGALQYQLRQLGPGRVHEQVDEPSPDAAPKEEGSHAPNEIDQTPNA
jgi:hypothetical protein